jgi:hypothetical protein
MEYFAIIPEPLGGFQSRVLRVPDALNDQEIIYDQKSRTLAGRQKVCGGLHL